MTKIIALVKEIVNKYLPYCDLHNVPENDDNLIEYGLDSLSSITLITEIESKFNLEFSFEDITLENFDTINKISDLLIKKYNLHIE